MTKSGKGGDDDDRRVALAGRILQAVRDAGVLPTLQEFAGDKAETVRLEKILAKDMVLDLYSGADTIAFLDIVAPRGCVVRGGRLRFAGTMTFLPAKRLCDTEDDRVLWRVSFCEGLFVNAAELPLCLTATPATFALDCPSVVDVEVYCVGTWTSGEMLASYCEAHPDVVLGMLLEREVVPRVEGRSLRLEPGALGPCPARLAVRFGETRPRPLRRVDVYIQDILADTLLPCDWRWEGATLALSTQHRDTGLPLRCGAFVSRFPTRLDIVAGGDEPLTATLVVHNVALVRLRGQIAALVEKSEIA